MQNKGMNVPLLLLAVIAVGCKTSQKHFILHSVFFLLADHAFGLSDIDCSGNASQITYCENLPVQS